MQRFEHHNLKQERHHKIVQVLASQVVHKPVLTASTTGSLLRPFRPPDPTNRHLSTPASLTYSIYLGPVPISLAWIQIDLQIRKLLRAVMCRKIQAAMLVVGIPNLQQGHRIVERKGLVGLRQLLVFEHSPHHVTSGIPPNWIAW